MFGPYVLVVKTPDMLTGNCHNLSRAVGKTFKHNLCLSAKEYALSLTYQLSQ
jgi:hypothetical protein